jgi:hypothetical protein
MISANCFANVTHMLSNDISGCTLSGGFSEPQARFEAQSRSFTVQICQIFASSNSQPTVQSGAWGINCCETSRKPRSEKPTSSPEPQRTLSPLLGLAQPRPIMASAPPTPIPITIVTGFLGAGKTTLILNLIPQLPAAEERIRQRRGRLAARARRRRRRRHGAARGLHLLQPRRRALGRARRAAR